MLQDDNPKGVIDVNPMLSSPAFDLSLEDPEHWEQDRYIPDKWEPSAHWPSESLPEKGSAVLQVPRESSTGLKQMRSIVKASKKLSKKAASAAAAIEKKVKDSWPELSMSEEEDDPPAVPTFPKGAVSCPVCGAKYKTSTKCKAHWISKHHKDVQPRFLCKFCKRILTSGDALKRHLEFHAQEVKICGTCKARLTTWDQVAAHAALHVLPDDSLFCRWCMQMLKTMTSRKTHEKSCPHNVNRAQSFHACENAGKGCRRGPWAAMKARNFHQKHDCEFRKK